MSKQLGNFYTLRQVLDKYGADAVRFSMAEAGDTMDDANFTEKNTNDAILRLSTLEMWLKTVQDEFKHYRKSETTSTYFDQAFDNQMKLCYIQTIRGYEQMKFRDVCKYGFHNFHSIKEEYICKPH